MIVGLNDCFGRRSSFLLADNGLHPITEAHIVRVGIDLGTIDDVYVLDRAVRRLVFTYGHNLGAKLALVIDVAIFGYKYRTDATGTWCVKAYSLMGASSDAVQSTASAQPLLLRWNSTDGNYIAFNGGGSITTPNTANTNQRGTFSVRSKIRVNASTGGSETIFSTFSTGTPSGFTFILGSTRGLVLNLAFGGVTSSYSSTAQIALAVYNAGIIWTRVDRDSVTGDINFYYSTDGAAWTQLGATVAGTAGNIDTSTSVSAGWGSRPDSLGSVANIHLYEGYVYNALGAVVVSYQASDYDVSVSQSTHASGGVVWAVNRSTATTGYKGQMVYRTTTQADATNDRLNVPVFVLAQPFTIYTSLDQFSWVDTRCFINSSAVIPVTQRTATPNISMVASGAIPFISEQLNKIQIFTSTFKGAGSVAQTDNGVEQVGNPGAGDFATLDIYSRALTQYGNGSINTVIVAKQTYDATTRTATYTTVYGWNGNPA